MLLLNKRVPIQSVAGCKAQDRREENADRHIYRYRLGVLRVKGRAHWMIVQVVKQW